MHSTQHALPGPPILPPVFYAAQPPAPFFGPVIPAPPPPPCPGQPASGSPKPPGRRDRGRRHTRHPRSRRARHPSPGHATTISDDKSDRGGSLPPDGHRDRSTSQDTLQSRSASPCRFVGDMPTPDSMVGRFSVASSSLDPESKSCLNDLVQNGGDPASPIEKSPDNNYDATHHCQSALEALESDPDLHSLNTEDGPSDPATRQRVGRANRRYEINQDRHTNAAMFIRPAGDESPTCGSRAGQRNHRESQTAASTESSSASANEGEKVEPASPINITRVPTDALGLGVGESRVGGHSDQRQEPRPSRPADQGPVEGSHLGRHGPQNQRPPRRSWFSGSGPVPQQPIPESRIGGRQQSVSREFSEQHSAARRDFRGFPGMTGESRIGPRSSSSGQSYRQGDSEPCGHYPRPGRIQDSSTFGNLVPLQQSRSSSHASSNSHRRSASILNTGFFNNNLPEPNQNQGRSVVSLASSTGAVCSYDSDSDHTQRRRRATSLGGGSIFRVNTSSYNNNSNDASGYYGNNNGGRGNRSSVLGPGGFSSGGGARD